MRDLKKFSKNQTFKTVYNILIIRSFSIFSPPDKKCKLSFFFMEGGPCVAWISFVASYDNAV
jgi:hypothetical protein